MQSAASILTLLAWTQDMNDFNPRQIAMLQI